eukprot:SAG31_NODE_21341_length_552_cov_0.735099_1_plen_24_part_01
MGEIQRWARAARALKARHTVTAGR